MHANSFLYPFLFIHICKSQAFLFVWIGHSHCVIDSQLSPEAWSAQFLLCYCTRCGICGVWVPCRAQQWSIRDTYGMPTSLLIVDEHFFSVKNVCKNHFLHLTVSAYKTSSDQNHNFIGQEWWHKAGIVFSEYLCRDLPKRQTEAKK